jgi:endonuclease/exonuclease/phosphatase family metal-dependent hydrolase
MRIVSYNILDGGEGRADPLAEVIQAQRADVVVLLEADDPTVVRRIAARLKMDFIEAPAKQHAAALLSRWTIAGTINHSAVQPALRGSLLEATVIERGDRQWSVGVVHLPPYAAEEAEQQREADLKILLDLFAPHRHDSRRHLLVGDFNANAPDQQIDPQQAHPSTRRAWDENGGQIPRRVVQRLLDAGYLDTMHVLDPQRARTSGTFSTQFPQQRVDYIFAHGIERAQVRSAWIEHDRLAKYASDHFPVGAEIG